MANRVLIIDDELTPKKGLGKRITNTLKEMGFESTFAQTWSDDGFHPKAKDILKTDSEIRMILLDIFFPKQKLEGGAIFDEIKKIKPKLPVVILTKCDKYTEYEEFDNRGTKDYIVKSTFEKRSSKLLNYLKSISQNPENEDLTLILNKKSDEIFFMDIHDEKGYTVIKQRRVLNGPLLTIVLRCIDGEDRITNFPDADKKGYVKDLEPWDRTMIQKEVWKFNRSLRDSSRGHVHSLLKGMGIHGASAFKLVIGNIKLID